MIFTPVTLFFSPIKQMGYTFQKSISLKSRLKGIFLATFGYNHNCFRFTSSDCMKIWLKALHYFINVTLLHFRCSVFQIRLTLQNVHMTQATMMFANHCKDLHHGDVS